MTQRNHGECDVDDDHPVFRLVLLGKCGSGKSSTGNSILGQPVFQVGHGFRSHRNASSVSGPTCGLRLEVVDTPGLFYTDEDLESEAQELVQSIRCLQSKLDAFLFVISATGRFTERDSSSYKCLKALFDQHISNHVIIVFTGGDILKEHGIDFGELLSTAPKALSTMMAECGGRYLVFDNTEPDREMQRDKLIKALRDLKDRNGGACFQSPYDHLDTGSIQAEVKQRLRKFRLQELEEEEEEAYNEAAPTHGKWTESNTSFSQVRAAVMDS